MTEPNSAKCIIYREGVRCERFATRNVPGIGNVCAYHGRDDGTNGQDRAILRIGRVIAFDTNPDNHGQAGEFVSVVNQRNL